MGPLLAGENSLFQTAATATREAHVGEADRPEEIAPLHLLVLKSPPAPGPPPGVKGTVATQYTMVLFCRDVVNRLLPIIFREVLQSCEGDEGCFRPV